MVVASIRWHYGGTVALMLAARKTRSRATASSTRSVERALSMLAVLAAGEAGYALNQLAQLTGLAPSTALRFARTLQASGFARRDEAGRYHAGAQLLGVGAIALSENAMYEIAAAHLAGLAEETGETAHLAMLDQDGQVLYLRHVPSAKAVRHIGWSGPPFPPRDTAIGEALLGLVGPEGYVALRATLEPDVTAIAAPIRGRDGQILAAVSVTGPTYRISDSAMEQIGAAVAREAREISLELGARGMTA